MVIPQNEWLSKAWFIDLTNHSFSGNSCLVKHYDTVCIGALGLVVNAPSIRSFGKLLSIDKNDDWF